MSSTYVIGKRAAACQAEDGTIFYMLSELSYESNLSPRDPKWCVRYFGTYEDCIRTVIWFSGGVEGGCTKGSARTPSAYIKQWRNELANPVALRRTRVSARFGKGFYDIPESSRERVAAVFEMHKHDAPGEALELDMGAPDGLHLLAELVDSRIEGMPCWKLLEHSFGGGAPDPRLGRPTPTAIKRDLETVQVYRYAEPGERCSETEYVTVLGGRAVTTGWAYRTVREFLTGEVAEAEVATPGAAEPMVAAFRRLIEKAAVLHDDTEVEVRRPGNEVAGARWHQETFEQLKQALGSGLGAEQILHTTMRDVRKAQLSRELGHLPWDSVTFTIASKAVSASGGDQLDLLAA